MVATACPGRHALERYLHGESPDEESSVVEAHLSECESCLESLSAEASNDPLVLALQHPVPFGEPITDEIELLIAQLRQRGPFSPSALSMAETTVAQGPEQAEVGRRDEPTEEMFDFLAPAEAPDELGRLGPYRVLRVLGAGGMGVVFRAEDPHLKRVVALKAMKRSLGGNEAARTRFLREAQSVAALENDHIVPVYQAGEDRGVLYLAMPLLKGETLSDRLQRERRLPVAEALRIAREIAQGLAAAHAEGIIHRDVKPANTWLEAGRGRVKLLDFGLARAIDDAASVTHSGLIAGTPQYMSPEQARGTSVTLQSDLFSLGSVLYHMLTGTAPFRGNDTIATLVAVANENPVPPTKIDPSVPRAVSDLVLRLLARMPEDRPESAEAVVEAITALEHARAAPPPRRRGRGVLLAAAGGALALLGAIVIALKSDEGTLVLTINAPDAKVVVDGKEKKFAITSPRDAIEIRLAPGGHQLEVSKDGYRSYSREFKIVRGGKEELSARLDPLAGAQPPPGASADGAAKAPVAPLADEPRPFVLIGAGGERRGSFKHFAAVVAQLQDGEVIEVHGNGPFRVPRIELEGRGLHLRAASGYRPRFVSTKQSEFGSWINVFRAPMHIEGCDFVSDLTNALAGSGALCEIVNCRLLAHGGCNISYSDGKVRIVDSLVANDGGGFTVTFQNKVDAVLTNNLIHSYFNHPSSQLAFYPGAETIQVRLNRNTISSGGALLGVQSPAKQGKVVVEAAENVFWLQEYYVATSVVADRIRDVLDWHGRDNLYAGNATTQPCVFSSGHSPGPPIGSAGWKQLWGDAEVGARECRDASFAWSEGSHASPAAWLAVLKRETERVRIRTGLNELGPDWSLVGPGEPYVRALAAAGHPVPQDQLRPESDAGGPFAIVHEGKPDDGHPSLNRAIEVAAGGDAIEIRSDGPFDGIRIPSQARGTRPLTIRAAPGYQPVLRGQFHFVEAGPDVVFEGIDFRGTQLFPGATGRLLRLSNCSIQATEDTGIAQIDPPGRACTLEFVNCQMYAPPGALALKLTTAGSVTMCNSVIGRMELDVPDGGAARVSIDHCVAWDARICAEIFRIQGSGARQTTFSARDSLFELMGAEVLLRVQAPAATAKLVTWEGVRNVYRNDGARWVYRVHGNPEPYADFASWQRADWVNEKGSRVADSLLFEPAQWRLLPNSPGYHAAKDGTDLGADVDRVAGR